MKSQRQFNISMFPTFIGQLDQLIEKLEKNHNIFNNTKNSSVVIDKQTVDKAKELVRKTTQQTFDHYEQLHKWKAKVLSPTQQKSLNVFSEKIAQAVN